MPTDHQPRRAAAAATTTADSQGGGGPAAASTTTPARSHVYVYAGEGAGMRSMLSALDALKAALPGAGCVTTIGPDAVIDGAWTATAALLVMPGGADLPYCRVLEGAGNAVIARFVSDGGAYLGLCAGGYYGAARVDFEPWGDPAMAVEGARELAFFPGSALGAAVRGFEYESEAGAAAMRLAWRRVGAPPMRGGGGQSGDDIGRWQSTRDYCNGGPVFARLDGGAWEDDDAEGVAVIARYEGGEVEAGAAATPSQPPTSPAPAAAAGGGVAAVRVLVGRGAAVLCGTHPELAPAAAWLLGGEEGDGGGGAKSAALAAELDGDAAGRAAFWGALLEAVGVGELMVVRREEAGGGGDGGGRRV